MTRYHVMACRVLSVIYPSVGRPQGLTCNTSHVRAAALVLACGRARVRVTNAASACIG